MIGVLSKDPQLLTALFELEGETFPVIVDTGATISFIPQYGAIMKHNKLKTLPANLNVLMADDTVVHIDKKVNISMRPHCSKEQPSIVPFYVNNGADKVLGREALIGLNVLRMFDINISFKNNIVYVYHQQRLIGEQVSSPLDYKASIRVDERFNDIKVETEVLSILKKYKKVFTDIDAHPIDGGPMRIFTTHPRPIFAKQRHYNPEEVLKMKEHIKSLLGKGIIESTDSGYAATSRIIPKKSGASRLVVNYIPLNAVTLRDSYSLPHITDIFSVLQGNKYFTTMDCSQGFYQISVDVRDRHKTAFSTPIGNYQFTRCPFGARNSCAVFQSEMNRIFAEGLFTRCVVYVDDILVMGKTKVEHDQNLAWVLAQCAKHHVKIKLDKCSFAKSEVKYLGFLVSGSYIKPLPDKIQSLTESRPPTDKTELRSIVGKLNFYSRFIPNYSKQLEPLRELFRKNKDFQWHPNHQKAFKEILKSLEEAPSQVLAPTSAEKILDICVMPDSIEALCLDDKGQLMGRMSRLLSSCESNYSFIEKQMLALILGVNKFRIWLTPGKVTIRVPSKEVKKQFSLINKPTRVDNMLLRLPEGFDEFKFEVKDSSPERSTYKIKDHVPQEIYYVDGACRLNGKPNCRATWAVCAEYDSKLVKTGFVEVSPSNNSAELTAAIQACKIAKERGQDEISIVTDSKYLHSAAVLWIDKWKTNEWKDHRNHQVVNIQLFKELLEAKDGLQIEWIHVRGHGTNEGNIRADSLARELLESSTNTAASVVVGENNIQPDCPELQIIRDRINNGLEPNLIVEQETIYYVDKTLPQECNKRIYVPKTSRYCLMKLAHDDPTFGGHLGIKKTFNKLKRFWWPGQHKEVEAYVKSCNICQMFKEPVGSPPGLLHNIKVSRVFEHLHLDIVGHFKPTCRGNLYIITATDAFSKYAFARACQNIRTAELIRFLEECIISIHGKPEVIVTDRGTQFTSNDWKIAMEKLKIKHNLTSSYHPQANGIDERLNGTLVRILRTYVSEEQGDWDEKLKWALYVYNTTDHNSTKRSPYTMIHGLEPRSPLRGNTDTETIDFEQLDRMRELLRAEARASNIKAQKKQAKEYNSRHSECKLKVGQIVLARENNPPLYLSKKWYPKWKSPAVVIDLIGDRDKPRSVVLFDCSELRTKVVAIKDIKPYLERGQLSIINAEQNNYKEKEKDDVRCVEQSNEDFNSSKYYNLIDLETSISNENSPRSNYTFDLTNVINQPVSSSPKRRVTIGDNPITFNYSSEVISDETSHETVPEKEPPDKEEQPKSKYVMDFIIDDSIADPTYKPNMVTAQKSAANTSIRSQPDHNELSIDKQETRRNSQVSLIPQPRYNLRSHARKSTYDMNQSQFNNSRESSSANTSNNDQHLSISSLNNDKTNKSTALLDPNEGTLIDLD